MRDMDQLPVELQLQIVGYLDDPALPTVYGLGSYLRDVAALACTCRKLRDVVLQWRDVLLQRASGALLQVSKKSLTVYSTSRSKHILSSETTTFKELGVFARYRLLFPAVKILTDIPSHYLITTSGSLWNRRTFDWHYCEMDDTILWNRDRPQLPHWWAHVELGDHRATQNLLCLDSQRQPLCHSRFKVHQPAINWVQLPTNLDLSESVFKMLHNWYIDLYGSNIFLVLQWGSLVRSHNMELLLCSRFEKVEHCAYPPEQRQKRWKERCEEQLTPLLQKVGQALRRRIKRANTASRRQTLLRSLRSLQELV